MDRRYYRNYENYDTIVPRPEDFPVLNSDSQMNSEKTAHLAQKSDSVGLKSDDLVLIVVLVLLLMEEEKDMTAIFSVVALLLAGYIF